MAHAPQNMRIDQHFYFSYSSQANHKTVMLAVCTIFFSLHKFTFIYSLARSLACLRYSIRVFVRFSVCSWTLTLFQHRTLNLNVYLYVQYVGNFLFLSFAYTNMIPMIITIFIHIFFGYVTNRHRMFIFAKASACAHEVHQVWFRYARMLLRVIRASVTSILNPSVCVCVYAYVCICSTRQSVANTHFFFCLRHCLFLPLFIYIFMFDVKKKTDRTTTVEKQTAPAKKNTSYKLNAYKNIIIKIHMILTMTTIFLFSFWETHGMKFKSYLICDLMASPFPNDRKRCKSNVDWPIPQPLLL